MGVRTVVAITQYEEAPMVPLRVALSAMFLHESSFSSLNFKPIAFGFVQDLRYRDLGGLQPFLRL